MNNQLVKSDAAKPRLPKRSSTTVNNTNTTYRVSKALSRRMRAADERADAAEARKARAAEKKKEKNKKEADA